MRVIAVLNVRNEERFLSACLENLFRQRVEAYVCDDGSTDATWAIAQSYSGHGVCGLERIAHDGVYRWEALLRRKEALFRVLDADWLMHVDADEIHLPPAGYPTLADAFAAADRQGYDAVESAELTFIPTCEAPDHDHLAFQQTLRTYYPFEPTSPHCVRAFKKQDGPMEIAWSGGHLVRLPGRGFGRACLAKHYLFSVKPTPSANPTASTEREVTVKAGTAGAAAGRSRAAAVGSSASQDRRRSDCTDPWRRHWPTAVCRHERTPRVLAVADRPGWAATTRRRDQRPPIATRSSRAIA